MCFFIVADPRWTTKMKEHPMLPYDAGQVLIKCSDELLESAVELERGGFLTEAKFVRQYGHKISAFFNKHYTGKTHVFGLNDGKLK